MRTPSWSGHRLGSSVTLDNLRPMRGETMQRDDDRARWLALYVLCVGMLMIVLDVTIVNVALPSIQEDLHFSHVEPRVGRQRLPDRVRRPAAAGRPPRRPDRAPAHLPRRRRAVHARLGAVRRWRRAQTVLVAARFVQGIGGAMTSAVILGHDRDDVPRAARAGQGDRRVRVRRLGGRLCRAARRRRADAVDQLALDLLREHADRHRHDRVRGAAPAGARPGHRLRRGRRRPGRGADHERADARRLHDRQAGRRKGLGRLRARCCSAAARSRCSSLSSRARHAPAAR